MRKKWASESSTRAYCPEPVATSILAPLINGEIMEVWRECEQKHPTNLPRPVWCSELEMHNMTSSRKPRLDGVLAMPNFGTDAPVGLRGMVCAEHKLNDFDEAGVREALGNGMDVFALKESGEIGWPVVVMKVTLGTMRIELVALVPISEDKFASAVLWTDDGTKAYIFCLRACARALHGFCRECTRIKKDLQFGVFLKNIAYDKEERKYYKWFHESTHRRDNIALVKRFIDPGAIAVEDREGKTIFIEMAKVGDAGTEAATSSAFAHIVGELCSLHDTYKFGHGDIRLANLVLGAEPCILDFDYAGRLETQTYPANLAPITDGERHNDVQQAIENGILDTMCLKAIHDFFSLAAVMKLFQPMNRSHDAEWGTFTDLVAQGGQGISIQDFDLVLLESPGNCGPEVLNASGSPPDKKKGRSMLKMQNIDEGDEAA
jgi:hypothetical protein